ncbi:TIR domain-containing protein [Chitinophagaceae bacterium MMS25-I14]
MKVFISWSGERSRQVAELLSAWIQCVLQAVEPWLSSKDIDRGALWFSEITSQLSDTHNGIVCLTKSNLNKPWILFESGALAKGLSSNRVYTFLIDLQPNDIKDPLAQFNHTFPNKEGVYQLVRTINKGLEIHSLKEGIIQNVFETYWPQFENAFQDILDNTKNEDVVVERPKEDILDEILYSVRGMGKRLQKLEEKTYYSKEKIEEIIYNLHTDLELTSISDFPLSRRALNALNKQKIYKVRDLVNIDFGSIDDPKAVDEIKDVIEKFKL